MRQRYVWRADAAGREHWVPVDMNAPRPKPVAPMIIRDIQPYQSMLTGEIITGRAQHREHLHAHGCIEVGNDPMTPRAPEPLRPVIDDLKAAMEASPETHAEARAAMEAASVDVGSDIMASLPL